MIRSMTGYGKAEYLAHNHKTVVEIKSLNSKQLDLNLKLQSYYREKENDIRLFLSPRLERGKVDIIIYQQLIDAQLSKEPTEIAPINKDAFRYYYNELKSLGVDETGLAAAIVRIPGVIAPPTADQLLPEDEVPLLNDAVADRKSVV